jgi:MoxR-like ATPase
MINTRELMTELGRVYPNRTDFKPQEVIDVAKTLGLKASPVYKYVTSQPKVKRGVYSLQAEILPFNQEEKAPMSSVVSSIVNDEVFIPEKEDTYVAWGNFKDVEKIIQSRIFYPTYITGLSGNGKTMMVEQACARANREYVRVQITPETDEDDLIGGFRLVNGETVFNKGPVIKAMERGAILLIDEIDRGSNKIMCLQGVLEGKPILIKKTGEVVSPSSGFNVIATANTKGKGSDDGRFIAATIIDEAFLERFTITLEQPYPTPATEKKIIIKHMEKFNCVDKEFADLLTVWSETIRKTFEDGGVDEIISTRRLCHIVQSFSIFEDRQKSIELCVNRFDEDTKEAFVDLYSKVDVQPEASVDNEDANLNDILEAALNG